jgi:hypothetical protein
VIYMSGVAYHAHCLPIVDSHSSDRETIARLEAELRHSRTETCAAIARAEQAEKSRDEAFAWIGILPGEGPLDVRVDDGVAWISEALDLVESPGTHPIGAPGSVTRRAQDIGRRLESARAEGWKAGVGAHAEERARLRILLTAAKSYRDVVRDQGAQHSSAVDIGAAFDDGFLAYVDDFILPPPPSPPAPDATTTTKGDGA